MGPATYSASATPISSSIILRPASTIEIPLRSGFKNPPRTWSRPGPNVLSAKGLRISAYLPFPSMTTTSTTGCGVSACIASYNSYGTALGSPVIVRAASDRIISVAFATSASVMSRTLSVPSLLPGKRGVLGCSTDIPLWYHFHLRQRDDKFRPLCHKPGFSFHECARKAVRQREEVIGPCGAHFRLVLDGNIRADDVF